MVVNYKILDNYYNDYIDGVNIEYVEFRIFTYEELQEFSILNYYDNNIKQSVCWKNDGFVTPYGMNYLEFSIPYKKYFYLLGLVDNKKGKKTIAFCMEYDENYQFEDEEDKQIVYVSFLETNYFFRNMGIFTKALSYIKDIFSKYSVIVMTSESGLGIRVSLFKKFEELFNDMGIYVKKEEAVSLLVRKCR